MISPSISPCRLTTLSSVLIGEVDAEVDAKTLLEDVRADPIPHVRY